MAQARVATLILNRNLPHVTDRLVEHLKQWNGDSTDIYVVESGSDKDKLSQYCSFWADWPEALEKGLRWSRGFNYGLLELEKTGKRYDYYFLVMGDSVFDDQPTVPRLLSVMQAYPKIGILSPLSLKWSDKQYLSETEPVKCFWLVSHVSWLISRPLLERVTEKSERTYMDYLYDGTNFRGYYNDIELVMKAYQNDFAAAITSKATFREQEDLTLNNAQVMKTDAQAVHWNLMKEEGEVWMKDKYGFSGKGEFKERAAREYVNFMRRNPKYQSLSVIAVA